MDKILLKAYAKINLGLDVLRKREDGYHEVKMIMQSVDMYDELLFKTNKTGNISIVTNDSNIPVDEKNLVYKAVKLMKEEFNIIDGLDINLIKNIPVEAGMAGGSTDCAAAIKAVNKLFDLNLSNMDMMKIGKKLGADVPYCIMGGTALAEGIGEKLTKLASPPDCYLVIAKPGIGVSTRFVYENLRLDELENHPDIDGIMDAIKNEDICGLADKIANVLETVTIPAYPLIKEIKEVMINNGAANALMSGSGPTVFGIFTNKEDAVMVCNILKERNDIAKCCVTVFSDCIEEE